MCKHFGHVFIGVATGAVGVCKHALKQSFAAVGSVCNDDQIKHVLCEFGARTLVPKQVRIKLVALQNHDSIVWFDIVVLHEMCAEEAGTFSSGNAFKELLVNLAFVFAVILLRQQVLAVVKKGFMNFLEQNKSSLECFLSGRLRNSKRDANNALWPFWLDFTFLLV